MKLPYWFSKLGLLNMLLLQWFFIRLVDVGADTSKGWVHERWEITRWVVPLTGWYTRYVYVGKPRSKIWRS